MCLRERFLRARAHTVRCILYCSCLFIAIIALICFDFCADQITDFFFGLLWANCRNDLDAAIKWQCARVPCAIRLNKCNTCIQLSLVRVSFVMTSASCCTVLKYLIVITGMSTVPSTLCVLQLCLIVGCLSLSSIWIAASLCFYTQSNDFMLNSRALSGT